MSLESLPEGWRLSTLSNIISKRGLISDGDWVESKDQDPDGNIRLVQLADIGDGNFKNKSSRYMNQRKASQLNCTFLESGDILIARMPDPIGRACIFPDVGQRAVTVVDVCLVRTSGNSALNNTVLKHWINSSIIREKIAIQATGTTRKRITRKCLEALEFPVPPLAEQKQIAAKLDELLAQVDTIKTRLDAILHILKRFRQSVLSTAVSGRLTEGWRRENRNAFDFKKSTLSNLIIEMRNGLSQKPNEDGIGFPILRISAVRAGAVDQNEVRNLDISESDAERYKLTKGDLLFTRYNGTLELVGVCGLLNELLHPTLLYPDKLIRVRVDESKAISKFIEIYFSSPGIRQFVMGLVKSTSGQKGISGSDLQKIAVFVPNLSEQTEIVRRVEQLSAFADQIEQRVKDAQSRVNHLTQSILAKAFRGELTAEWRAQNPDLITGENSAEALLARIRAEREANAGTNKPRKRKAST